MKNRHLLILVSILGIFMSSGLLYAESQGIPIQADFDKSLSQQPSSEEISSVSDVKIIRDEFGGYMYFYNDEMGNRCATNKINNALINASKAEIRRPVSSIDIPREDSVEASLFFAEAKIDSDEISNDTEEEENIITISDPFEPINRIFFQFNDKLYFWFLKPVASGYRAIIPQPLRMNVKNFFTNIAFPIRFVNCVLQGKFVNAGDEITRFMINSTAGFAGLFDIATTHSKIMGQNEDLGQTLGSYGIGSAFYINWPFLGPSSLRDTFGTFGDSFLDPVGYAVPRTKYNIAVKGYETVNKTSLVIGDYEDLKKSALDPYIAVRNAYFQYRDNKIKD